MSKKYSHISYDTVIKELPVSKEEMEAVFFAYDYGIDLMSADDKKALDALIAKLKDIVWP